MTPTIKMCPNYNLRRILETESLIIKTNVMYLNK